MNVLIIPYYQIYPLKTGASIAQFSTVQSLSKLCNISLLLPQAEPLSQEELSELKKLLPDVKIYEVDKQDELLKTSHKKSFLSRFADSIRALKKLTVLSIKSILSKNLKTSYPIIPEEVSLEDEFSSIYTSYDPYHPHSRQYIEKINEIIIKDKISLVQLEFTENLSLVNALPSDVKAVSVQHECRFLRIASHIDAKRIESNFTKYVYNFNKAIELSLLEKFDGIITFNNSDSLVFRKALEQKEKPVKILTSPFGILDQDIKKIDPEMFGRINKLTFVGREGHFPNKDAVEWFIEELALEIYEKLGLSLDVIGEWNSETISKYKDHPSKVCFTGFVENLYEATRNSISISPVRIGGGLRTKILLAMAQGIPVICTSFALDGIAAKHLESVMIADDKVSFYLAVKLLMERPDQTLSLCQNAQSLLKKKYSQSAVSKLRHSFYQSLLEA